jgi:hypothetical protein
LLQTSCPAVDNSLGGESLESNRHSLRIKARSLKSLELLQIKGMAMKRLLILLLALMAVPASADVFINTGGNSIGTSYVADRYFAGGTRYTFGNQSGVYNTERWSRTGFSYAIPVTPGQIDVTLRLRESCVPCDYVRRFNVVAEGQAVLSNFTVAPNTVSDQTFRVTSDATLNLSFAAVQGEAWVNAIEVRQVSSTPPPTLLLTATPTSIAAGAASTLSWNSTNATSCMASGAWSGAKPTSGSQSTGVLSSTSTFTLNCSGSGGDIGNSVSVTVLPVPTVSLNATPSVITIGESATLSWVSNGTSCAASGGWTGALAVTGSQSTGPLTASTIYSITCSGASGSASASASVTVSVTQLPAPTLTFTANPATIATGGASTLTWSAANATSCMASGAWSGAKPTSGSQSTGALSATTHYALSCSGAGGTISRAVDVTVATQSAAFLINSGGPSLGSYLADRYYSGGQSYTFGNQSGVYNTERWSNSSFSYAIPVVPGSVQVTLRLRESCVPCDYVRRFNVTAEGQSVLSNVTVSPNTVSDRTFTVISDATLNLVFTAVSGEAYVNAIEVQQSSAVPAAPTLSFGATPTSVSVGIAAVLSWTASNATSCTATGGWQGSKATSGSESTGPLAATTNFGLSCVGAGGTATSTLSVVVFSTSGLFPLHTVAGTRNLVDAQGQPFLLHGDTPWSLIAQLKREEVDQYLEDRRLKGFNTVLVNLLEHEFSTNPPNDAYGDAPFLTPGDFSTPNEAYFSHAEYVIAKANEKGMLVMLTPAYLGYGGGSEGWYQELEANGVTKLRAYGQYLANRFRAYDNILWVHGGDYDPPDRSTMRAIVDGILDVDTKWLHTFHTTRGESALQILGPSETWLQANNIYTDSATVVSQAYTEYTRSSMPFFLIEARYEGESANASIVRQQAYQTMLSGGCGQLMGNNPVWFFGAGWQQALNSPGASTLIYLRSILEANNWWTLEPDVNAAVLTGGLGTGGGRAVLARSSDHSRALAYVPDTRAVTVSLAGISGPRVAVSWYDPTNGTTTAVSGSPFAAVGSQSFSAPGTNSRGDQDWVLVLVASP